MLDFNLTIEIALIKKKSSKHQETTTDFSIVLCGFLPRCEH